MCSIANKAHKTLHLNNELSISANYDKNVSNSKTCQKKKKKKEIKLSPTKQQFSCYNPIKTSLLAVVVAPVPFPF